MKVVDDLEPRRAKRRREVSMQLTSVGVVVQWDPHWEVTLRLTGRWWFATLAALTTLMGGVTFAAIVLTTVDFISRRDWVALSLVGAGVAVLVGMSLWWTRQWRRRGG